MEGARPVPCGWWCWGCPQAPPGKSQVKAVRGQRWGSSSDGQAGKELPELSALCLLLPLEIPDGVEAAPITAGCCVASCKYRVNWSVCVFICARWYFLLEILPHTIINWQRLRIPFLQLFPLAKNAKPCCPEGLFSKSFNEIIEALHSSDFPHAGKCHSPLVFPRDVAWDYTYFHSSAQVQYC